MFEWTFKVIKKIRFIRYNFHTLILDFPFSSLADCIVTLEFLISRTQCLAFRVGLKNKIRIFISSYNKMHNIIYMQCILRVNQHGHIYTAQFCKSVNITSSSSNFVMCIFVCGCCCCYNINLSFIHILLKMIIILYTECVRCVQHKWVYVLFVFFLYSLVKHWFT